VNEASSLYCYKCGLPLPTQIESVARLAGNPAGFWIRSAAFIIDQVFLSLIGVVIGLAASGWSPREALLPTLDPYSPWYWSQLLLGTAIEASYYTLTLGTWGKTLGKALLGLKVVRANGARLSYLRSFARYWAYYLSWLLLGLGFLVIAFSPQKRGLHDLACDTKVIKA